MKIYMILIAVMVSGWAYAEISFGTRDFSLSSFGQTSPDTIVVTGSTFNALPGSSFSNRHTSKPTSLSVGNDALTNASIRRVYATAECSLARDKDSTRSAALMDKYCSYLAGDLSACSGHGSSPEQVCQVDCAIKQNHANRIAGEILNLGTTQKKQACVDRVKSVLDNEKMAAQSPDDLRKGLYDTRYNLSEAFKNSREQRSLVLDRSNLNCLNSRSSTCDSFVETALDSSSITELASLFSVDYSRTRSGIVNFVSGKDGDCQKCMEKKYTAHKQLGAGGPDFDRAISDLKKQAVVKLAARKANEAISNYLKFIERNDFINRHVEVPKETCDGLSQLQSVTRRSCPNAAAILDEVKSPLPRITGSNPQSVLQNVLGAYRERMFNRKVSSPGICNGEYDFDLFQKSRLTLVGEASVAARVGHGLQVQKLWLDDEAMRLIEACGDQDTNCFIDIMARTKVKNTGTTFDRERDYLVGNLSLSPFLMTMLSSKKGIKSFYQMDGLSTSGLETVDQYIKRYSSQIVEAAHDDITNSCRDIGQDLQKALCTTAENYAENYTADELRAELASLARETLGDRAPEETPEFFIQMGMTCSLLTDSKSHLNNQTPKVASMSAVDRSIPALPFAGLDVQGFPSSVDSFALAASKQCAAAPPAPIDFSPTLSGSSGSPIFKTCRGLGELWTVQNAALPSCTSQFQTQPLYGSNSGINWNLFNTSSDLGFNPSLRSTLSTASDAVVDPGSVSQLDQSIKADNNSTTTNPSELVIADNTTAARSLESVNPDGELVSVTTAGAFASMSGNENIPGQPNQMNRSNYIVSSPVSMQLSQQVEATNNQTGTTLRREESLVRQESELINKVETQSIENRELREAVTQMRREMASMALQNAQLLPTLQSMMKARGATREEIETEVEEMDEIVSADASPVPKPKKSRSIASVPSTRLPERVSGQAQGTSEGGSRSQISAGNTAGVSGGVNFPQDSVRGSQVTQAPVAGAANINVNAGGARAGSGMERLVTRFTPSSQVTRQNLSAQSGNGEVGSEDKTQLVLEFLDYVKEYPLHRNGAYLSQANDSITVDYGGKEVVVKVDQITDPRIRSLVQERLISQRMNLNQQLRQARLTELRRLLAEASDVL